MTFIMQMHANQIQPSENQGWERRKKKNSTQRLNERMKEKKGDKRKNPFEWQEAVS